MYIELTYIDVKPTWSGDKSDNSRDNCQARVNLTSFINFNALAYHRSGQCKNTVEKEHKYLKQYESLLWKMDRLIRYFHEFGISMNLRIFQRKLIFLFT